MSEQPHQDQAPPSLTALLEDIWGHLNAGANAAKERSPYTMMQLATIGRDGLPKLRTVVLRRTVKERALLGFHTDARSEKVREIERNAHVALLSSDVQSGIQIRLEGVAHPVEDDDKRLKVWNSSRPGTLILYRAPLLPGSPIENPLAAKPSPEGTAPGTMAGHENFCLIDVAVTGIDYLDVSGAMHSRARFRIEDGQWRGQWVAP